MNLSGFDLNLLQVLDALLETRSTTLAGQRVGLSQPAVSAALARLRDALGDPILIRQGRGMVATDYAETLRDPLRGLLEQTQQLLSGNDRFDPQNADMTFRISGSDFYAILLMPQLADHLDRVAPGMRVQQVDLVPDNHVQSFDRYDVDLAILPETDFPSWIDSRRMHRSRFSVIARQDHPALAPAHVKPGDQIPLDLFCDLKHVVFSPEGRLRAMGDAALERVGRTRQVAMTLPVFSGVYHAVAQSDMIALIPHQLAEHMGPRLGLYTYTPPIPVDPVAISMVWHRRSTAAPAHSWLRDQIAAILAKVDDESVTVPFRPRS